MPTRIAMMAITTSSSISVNARYRPSLGATSMALISLALRRHADAPAEEFPAPVSILGLCTNVQPDFMLRPRPVYWAGPAEYRKPHVRVCPRTGSDHAANPFRACHAERGATVSSLCTCPAEAGLPCCPRPGKGPLRPSGVSPDCPA